MTLATTGAIAEISLCSPLYCAEQYDPDLGLYYLRARYYNPLTGRFLSRDPEDGNATDPKTLHKYLYAGGDPVNRIDPRGRDSYNEYGLVVSKTDMLISITRFRAATNVDTCIAITLGWIAEAGGPGIGLAVPYSTNAAVPHSSQFHRDEWAGRVEDGLMRVAPPLSLLFLSQPQNGVPILDAASSRQG